MDLLRCINGTHGNNKFDLLEQGPVNTFCKGPQEKYILCFVGHEVSSEPRLISAIVKYYQQPRKTRD